MTVIGVVGGSGGVGASTFATVLAAAASRATLVDLDPVGGGIDVLLGIEDVPGARWSGLRVDGGYLDPQVLHDGLPSWRDVAVLAADGTVPGPDAVVQVLEAAAERGPVVVDLPRAPAPAREAAVGCCGLVVVVVLAEVRAVVAARAVLASLGDTPAGVVLRRGGLSDAEVLPLLGTGLLGVLPDRGARGASRVAHGVLDGLAA